MMIHSSAEKHLFRYFSALIFFALASALSGQETLPEPVVHAQAAVVLDFETGTVLYERNADVLIPPASLTKLVTIYLTCSLVQEGKLSYDDPVDISVNAWAAKWPGSSLMFLEPGQRVTVGELLLGLSVASGNDAAIALAEHISGSVRDFAALMNKTMQELDLSSLHFVDSSGLSGRSVITARDFAHFSRIYLSRFPENLEKLHSVKEISYPLPQNMPVSWRSPTQTIHQYNRNRLLWDMEEVDGLKTGFVVESGYNFALTGKRGDMRLIVVTLGGPGRTAAEGNRLRAEDGATLLSYGFDNFTHYLPELPELQPVKVWKGREKELTLQAEAPDLLTLPKIIVEGMQRNTVQRFSVQAPVPAGSRLGEVRYESVNGFVHTIPLTASRDIPEGSFFRRLWDGIVLWWKKTFGKSDEEWITY